MTTYKDQEGNEISREEYERIQFGEKGEEESEPNPMNEEGGKETC